MAATQELSDEEVLDLSNQGLKKLSKPSATQSKVSKLILDNNDLTRLDCIDSFTAVKHLSAARNGLLRMYNVTRLHHLVSLNLAHNGILTIEGLKEATHLKWLCLAANNIKTIEHLNTNTLLEYIDLSENNISFITDLSYLTSLKTLLLNSNKIGHLHSCDKFLPVGLDTLSLAANNITDLNQVSFLVNLRDLRQLSIANNPCVAMTGSNVGFDYRPFLINWCMGLKVIDGFMVNEIESLKAEWLYSQGRGRQFRPGDHESLVAYLANTCPLGGESLETEEDRKLRLILSKAQHHQQQLKQQQTDGPLQRSSSVSPFTRRRTSNSYNRSSLNRGRRRTYTPDRMTSSFHSELPSSGSEMSPLMTQSLDLSLFNSSDSEDSRRKLPTQLVPQDEDSPLHSATEMIPVPDSLLSPEFRPIEMIPSGTPAQTPATPATPATPSHPLAKKGIAQPLASGLPRPSSGRSTSRLPVRGGGVPIPAPPLPAPGGCLDDSSTSRQAVSLGTPFEQPETPSMEAHFQTQKITTGESHLERQNLERQNGKLRDDSLPRQGGDRADTREAAHNDVNGTEQPIPTTRSSDKVPPTPPKPMQRSEVKRPTSLGNYCFGSHGSHGFGSHGSHGKGFYFSFIDLVSDLPFHYGQTSINGRSEVNFLVSNVEGQKCAATNIQRIWRGYQARNLDPRVVKVSRSLQDKRTLEHIRKLTEDLEGTKTALESERRLQLLQMQAISALWKKVVALQQSGAAQPILPNMTAADLIGSEQVTSSNSAECIRKLTHSCLHLHTQVAELQQSMQEVTSVLGLTYRQGQIPRVSLATQTDLSAVHTPSEAINFPFQKDSSAPCNPETLQRPASATSDSVPSERVPHRPSSLLLNAPHPPSRRQTPPQLNHFANSLLDGVLKTVSSAEPGNETTTTAEGCAKQEATLESGK
ncbi:centrosomal protein of 97 kDa isoform X2 [Thrips palmi]|uniref:Centrosomal protein of 97 kDa n=1 Tax=Thrips palmi TaxID=161013 RepID=A0A6P8YWM5_THRPL|nr:centrosomal protein of 97 kDa isoform X2 [Thrips palmi]